MTDESPEARAAAKWVERRFNYPAGSVSRVDFCVHASEGCPTCGYGGERDVW